MAVDARMLQIWRSAPITLTLSTRADAYALRHKLYAARKLLYTEPPGSPLHPVAQYTRDFKIVCRPVYLHPDHWTLDLVNEGAALDKVIEAAGIGVPEAPPLDLEEDNNQ